MISGGTKRMIWAPLLGGWKSTCHCLHLYANCPPHITVNNVIQLSAAPGPLSDVRSVQQNTSSPQGFAAEREIRTLKGILLREKWRFDGEKIMLRDWNWSYFLLPQHGPPWEEERGEPVVNKGLSRSSWIPEELTGMYNLECASLPHLWGNTPAKPGLSHPTGWYPVIDNWKNYLAQVHKSQGAGMASSEYEPMAGGEFPTKPGGAAVK